MATIKSGLKISRDRFLGNVNKLVPEILIKLDQLKSLTSDIHDSQLKINHDQINLIKEINGRTKNSGNVVLSNSEMVTKIFSGLKLYLDPRDLAVVPHLALDSIWEHQVTSAWLSLVKPGDIVFDIGANFGYFGVLAAQLTDKKKSKVIMFEPNPSLIPYIQKTLSVNWLNEQCVVENLAVGNKEGQLTLHVLKEYIGSSSVKPMKDMQYMAGKMALDEAKAIKVPAITIDEYCKQHNLSEIDLIKVDIEGYEDKAYQGMRSTVQQSPNLTMFIEFTWQAYDDPKAFYGQMIEDFGNVYLIDSNGMLKKQTDTSYEKVIGKADDWVMPVFSKNPMLITNK